MRVFYALCLLLAIAYHVAALCGFMNPQAPLQHYSPLALVIVAFFVAVITHPKSRGHSQGVALTWKDAVAHVGPAVKWLSAAAFVYGVLLCAGAIQRAQTRLGTEEGVTTEQLGPIGVTAFGFAFGAISWLAGVSSQNLKAELIRRGEWFR
jgi:hypothetical protein